jgi:AsmA protein
MNGSLSVDARNTPSIAFKQDMKGIAIGPLLVDAINNDMLDGRGSLNVDVSASGNTVGAMKKALNGKSSLQLADGAIKGIDIAGTIRNAKSKLNILKGQSTIGADQTQKTDFSELTASFDIKNGVAHNEDLAMKAPILRLAKGDSRGDVDIANETINYLAKPTIVKSIQGQGGADLDALAGVAIPIKVTGTFSAPKYGVDFASLGTAIAKSNLLDKVGGDKAGAAKGLIGDGDKVDALKGLLGKSKPTETAPSTANATTDSTTTEQPKSAEEIAKEKAEKKLKKLLNF